MRIPDTASLTIAGASTSLVIADAITSIALSADAGSVAQLTIEATDPAGVIARSGLATTGTAVSWYADPWQVGSVTTTWGSDNTITLAFDCRSTLARKLRKVYKASAEKKVSPSAWVARRVAAAGGRAVCQASSVQATIAQKSGNDRQSELDVIESLASEVGWTWVEWGGTLWFGSRHWAWTGGGGARLWQVNWKADPANDALAADLTLDDDDTESAASGSVSVPYDYGIKMRPWDRIRLGGFGSRNGIYLIDAVSITGDKATPVALTVSQPLPPSKKSGST
jgi:hypothetical protein